MGYALGQLAIHNVLPRARSAAGTRELLTMLTMLTVLTVLISIGGVGVVAATAVMPASSPPLTARAGVVTVRR